MCSQDGSSWNEENVRITGTSQPQLLEDGVYFAFGSKFGHVESDYWDFETGTDFLVDPLQVSDYLGNSLLVVKNDGELDVNGNIKVGSSDSYLIGSVKICSGSGSPNTVVSAPLGSLYLNTSGGAGTTLYVKESGGTGNPCPSNQMLTC